MTEEWQTAPVIRADLGSGVRAGFTTRAGGLSVAPWDTLNLSAATGDDPNVVRRNRELVEGWLGASVAFARQVHGATAATIREVPTQAPEVDAFVTATPGLGLAILVADCAPVLFADPAAGVIGAAHCGRAGLVAGVLQATVAAMADLGAREVTAAIGPVICGACYEVPATMRDEVADVLPATAATTSWGTPAIDLAAGVESVLAGLGIPVSGAVGCTRTDHRFYSHRLAAGAPTGRTAGVVVIR